MLVSAGDTEAAADPVASLQKRPSIHGEIFGARLCRAPRCTKITRPCPGLYRIKPLSFGHSRESVIARVARRAFMFPGRYNWRSLVGCTGSM